MEGNGVTVKIAGVKGTVTIEPHEDAHAGEVLQAAAEKLGAVVDTTHLAVVVNGKDATLKTPVESGDRVSAAPQAANG